MKAHFGRNQIRHVVPTKRSNDMTNSMLNSIRGSGVYNLKKEHYSSPNDNYPSLYPSSEQIEQKCMQLGQCYYRADSKQTNKFDTIRLAIPDNIIKRSASKGKKLGIRFINYDTWKHCQIWEFSAKILKANYQDLISKYNIDQFVSEINKSKLLDVSEDEFYNQVMVVSADVAIDLPFEGISEILGALCNCVLSLHWFRQPYQRGVIKESVLFRSKAKHKSSAQFYDKSAELHRIENLELMKYIDPSYFDNILRAEFRFKKMDGFRSVWGLPAKNQFPLLKDLLESNINVPLTQFKKIVQLNHYLDCPDNDYADIFEKIQQFPKRCDQKELAFWYLLIKNFKENRDDIDSFLRVNSKSIDRDRKKLSKHLATISQTTKSPTTQVIRTLLQAFGESYGK